jgi:TolB-like protein/DNA-binding winged helix-turn-helix (wHTH) protein
VEQATEKVSRLTYSFGPFHLDPAERRLSRDDRDLRLPPKVFETLVLLVERHGLLVSKNDLMTKLWPDTFVEEVTLAGNISSLRKTLGDESGQDQGRYIETVSKRGYRFIAQVTEIEPPTAQTRNAPETKAEITAPRVPGRWWQNRRAWIALSGLTLLLAGAAVFWSFKIFRSPANQIHSLAVLPLENLSGNPDQEYFADGMTDDLITNLAQIHSLRVISRTSVMQFKHTKKTLPEIAAALNVDAIVEGSVSRSGNNVHVTAQLLNARQDRHLWAATYERQMAEIFGLQTEIARTIADRVQANLTHEENARLTRQPSRDPRAYDAYLKGRYVENRKHAAPEGKAVGYFQQAVTIDPNYAEAWAELGNSYVFYSGVLGAEDRAATIQKARAAIAKALQLDPNLAAAYNASGWVKMAYDWDWPGAERDLKRAIELDPNYSVAHRNYSHYLLLHRRFDEALQENRLAIDLDPLDILGTAHMTQIYLATHQPDKVIAQCKQVLEMDPAHVGVYAPLAGAYAAKGQWSEAFAAWDHLKELHLLSDKGYLANVAPLWTASGDKRRGDAAIADLKEWAKDHPVPPLFIATYEARFGDEDQAFKWLEKAYQIRDPGLTGLEIDASFDNLRSDPRFLDLERRVGFR